MHFVDNKHVIHWENHNSVRLPIAIGINCSKCGQKVSFALGWPGINHQIMSTQSQCPHCTGVVLFLLVDIPSSSGASAQYGTLFMHPAPKIRSRMKGLDEVEDFPTALNRAYISAVNVYNAGEWNGAASLSRRLLEGIAKNILPNSKHDKPLHVQIQSLPDHRDLKQPFITLAHAIREAGNMGAHFDIREANEETATLMLDLLEYLMEYLYLLPKQINQLDEAIRRIDGEQPAPSEG